MPKLTEKKLCDVCERIVKIERMKGQGLTTDIFKAVKKAKMLVKDLTPTGKKLIKDLVKDFNDGKVSLESAIRHAKPLVQTMMSVKNGGAFTRADFSQSFGSGYMESNLPEGTSTSSMTGEGAVLAGEGARVAGEVGRGYGKGARIAGESKICGKGSILAKHSGAGKKTNPWLVHLKAFRASHPGMSYKDAMSKAKLTYKK